MSNLRPSKDFFQFIILDPISVKHNLKACKWKNKFIKNLNVILSSKLKWSSDFLVY
jgi:hypothetical protein